MNARSGFMAMLAVGFLCAITMSAAGPPQDTRPQGGTARSDARGDPTSAAHADDDFSAHLDALWDYRDAAASEQRFRTELARYTPASREALEIQTQIARTLGLRRQFDAAHALLDQVAPSLEAVDSRVRVRYLLERGRAYNSAGSPSRAVPLFQEAFTRSENAGRRGDTFYTIDALHMLGIAAPPAEQLDWNLKALAAAEAADDPRARRWQASLNNNIGWYYHDRGDYAQALSYFERALPAWEARGNAVDVRTAKWTIARALRSLKRYDEAFAIQSTLCGESEAAGSTDGYVYEELGELEIARGNAAAARPWFAKAYALLKDDSGFVATEPARLARLAKLGGVGASAP